MYYINEEHTQSIRVSLVNLGHKTNSVEPANPFTASIFVTSFLFVWPWTRCSSFVSPPQSAVYLAGPQCTVHDSLPAQGLHQGDEWRRTAPTVFLPGEGTRLLWRWAPSQVHLEKEETWWGDWNGATIFVLFFACIEWLAAVLSKIKMI